jgi:hypothetical protein
VYQQGGGSQFFMRIRDNAGGTGGGKEALVRWFETIGDIDAAANTGPMPVAAQSSLTDTSWVIRKSSVTSTAAALWAIAADDRTVYLAISTGDNGTGYYGFAAGDFYSFVNGDPYRVFLIGRNAENSGAVGSDTTTTASVLNSSVGGHAVMRLYTGAVGAINASKFGSGGALLSSLNSLGGQLTTIGGMTFPSQPDGGIYVAPILISDVSSATIASLRGRFRGWLQWLHAYNALNDRDTFSGVGSNAGRQFIRIGNVQSAVGVNCALIWDASPRFRGEQLGGVELDASYSVTGDRAGEHRTR